VVVHHVGRPSPVGHRFGPDQGVRVELSTGYQGAWTNGLGDYLLSDSPGFDPGRDLGGNWRELVRE